MAPMPDVAKGAGYGSPTSTSFYRRLVAARLFGLIGLNGAAITKRANDYLKPDQEDAKSKALQDAISGIAYYSELIEKYRGRKLNPDLVKNAISKDFNLMEQAAASAAKAFSASLKFSGLLSADEIVGVGTPSVKTTETPPATPPTPTPSVLNAELPAGLGTHTYELPLDKENKRKIRLNAPLDITDKEVKRVAKWIDATLLIDTTDEQV